MESNVNVQMNKDPQDKYRDGFWSEIEKGLYLMVPMFLKNIFKYQNLDSPAAMTLTEDNLKEMEEFVRSEAYYKQISEGTELRDYYGNFYYDPKSFKFLIGEKNMILAIKKFLANQPEKFWKKLMQSTSTAMTSASSNSRRLAHNDLEKEKQKILDLLKKNKKTVPKDLLEFLPSIKTEVTIQNNLVIAKVICPKCDTEIQATKKDGKWILSNFRRHFHNHSGLTKKTRKRKSQVKTNNRASKGSSRTKRVRNMEEDEEEEDDMEDDSEESSGKTEDEDEDEEKNLDEYSGNPPLRDARGTESPMENSTETAEFEVPFDQM